LPLICATVSWKSVRAAACGVMVMRLSLQKRVVGGERLLAEHVEHGGRKLPAIQQGLQVFLHRNADRALR
jgi:hypothetical protein